MSAAGIDSILLESANASTAGMKIVNNTLYGMHDRFAIPSNNNILQNHFKNINYLNFICWIYFIVGDLLKM